MKTRYDWLIEIIDYQKPQTLCEIGVHRGDRAWRMCEAALKHNEIVSYIGYDLWEHLRDHQEVYNGKGPSTKADAEKSLRKLERQGFVFGLIQGDHAEKVPESTAVDFVFIDGDHRIEAIQRDYERVYLSDTVVFDDHYTPEIDGIGCNQVVIRHRYKCLMPSEDREKYSMGLNRLLVATRNYALYKHLLSLGGEKC